MYQPKNFDALLGTPGFSDQMLKNHFTLYEGYVTNVNKLTDELVALTKEGKVATPSFAELKRRFGWEWNGMRLHELYFENLTKQPTTNNQQLTTELEKQFGSFDNWLADFKATGAMRGIGWVILYEEPVTKNLFNVWVSEHDMGHLAGCTPLLVLDLFEHAYTLDYGIKKADYLEAFVKAIDWGVVAGRI
jgi:Fe-Mn family superoxide dismutase